MKKAILFLLVLIATNSYSQDYKILSDVSFGKGIISKAPNYIEFEVYYLKRISDTTFRCEMQYFTKDSLGHMLLPNDDLVGMGGNNTRFTVILTNEQAGFPPDSVMNLFFFPYLDETIYPAKVEKKALFNKSK